MSYFKMRHANRGKDGDGGSGGENGKALWCLSRHVKCLVVVLFILPALLLPPAEQAFAGVPTDGLLAWYPFDGNANDASGNANNGVLPASAANQPTLASDQLLRPNHAYAFDGIVGAFDYITVPYSPPLSFSTGFSASFWVRFNQVNRNNDSYDWQALFTKDSYPSLGLMLCTDSSCRGTLRLYHAGLTPSTTDYLWRDVLPNTWYNIVVTYDGSHSRFYINGIEKSSTAVTGTLAANTWAMYLGISGGVYGPYPFDGKMDSVRFYNRALTAQEVLDIYIDGALPSVSAGGYHTCGVRTDGTLACWGSNSHGQSTPPDATFTQVSAGESHTCGLKTDGTIACWGAGTTNTGTIPNFGQSFPPSGTFTQVDAGMYHTCGVKTDKTVACWGVGTAGFPNYGQSIPPSGTFTQVSAGDYHTCGVKTDGTVACWGNNGFGQAPPSMTGPFTQVSAGGYHTCGLKTDGTIACWGYNDFGQAPPSMTGPFTQVSAGLYHNRGLKTDGTVACWGDDSCRVRSLTGQFTQVSAGDTHSCGVKTDGTIFCGGWNYFGSAPPTVSISTTTLPEGTKDAAYSHVLSPSGGTGAPYAFGVTGGQLPSGLSLSTGGTLSGTPTASGSHAFTVRVFDGTGLLGTSQDVQLVVKEYGSVTGVVSSANPSTYGQSITLTATVTATPNGATGTVTFYDGATPICTNVAVSGGQATCSTSALTGGQHSITAAYSGDVTYTGSRGTVEQNVTPATVSLNIAFAGAGGNKVDSILPNHGINCTKGSETGCSASITTGLPVTLYATADWKSAFTGWSNGVTSSNNPVTFTMDANKTVTATFDYLNRAKLLLGGGHYGSIQDACDAAANGDTILAQEFFFQEPQGVTIGPATAKTLTLKGGYALGDENYGILTGITRVLGPLTIAQGSLTVEGLAVTGPPPDL